jgi:biopolymer transport protein ExbB/TolQ
MNLIERFHEGGLFMWFILAFGMFTLYIILDRVYALYLHLKPVPSDFRDQIRSYLRRGDLDGAIDHLRSQKKHSLTPVIEMALNMRKEAVADDELQSRLDESLSEQIERIDRRTSFLAVCGNVATLLGLLGTISGMITAFAAVSSATSVERAGLLSAGISEAMNCTAFGLLVAIPALVGFAVFQNKTDRITAVLTDNVTKIYHDLIYLHDPAGQPTSK